MTHQWIDGVKLPVLDNCDNCGACCFEQGSPPGYLLFTGQITSELIKFLPDDYERFVMMPADAKAEINDYIDRLENELTSGGGPCCWLDIETRRCRWYQHRPSICRDFELNSEECHGWRDDHVNLIDSNADNAATHELDKMLR